MGKLLYTNTRIVFGDLFIYQLYQTPGGFCTHYEEHGIGKGGTGHPWVLRYYRIAQGDIPQLLADPKATLALLAKLWPWRTRILP